MTNTMNTTRGAVCFGCLFEFEVSPGPGRPAKFCCDDCRRWHALELRRLKRERRDVEATIEAHRLRLRHPAVARASRQALAFYEPRLTELRRALEALRLGGALDPAISERPNGVEP